jgi:hypothetical protein
MPSETTIEIVLTEESHECHSQVAGEKYEGPEVPVLRGLSGWLRGLDLNQRPLGYEPNELPGCSTPR